MSSCQTYISGILLSVLPLFLPIHVSRAATEFEWSDYRVLRERGRVVGYYRVFSNGSLKENPRRTIRRVRYFRSDRTRLLDCRAPNSRPGESLESTHLVCTNGYRGTFDEIWQRLLRQTRVSGAHTCPAATAMSE